MEKELLNKVKLMKKLLEKVFYHEEWITETILAAFVSRSHILLLGERGSGKTHVAECILNMIDQNITATVQGYLGAEIEDIFARPDIPQLLNGKEVVLWKSPTKAIVKFFDEIQRLGVGALSALFRLLTKGTVLYLDQELGEKTFWVIATANPQERSNDQLNVSLPEPLIDRFDVVLQVPNTKLKYQLLIDDRIELMKEQLPKIWDRETLLQLWKTVENIKIPIDVKRTMVLMNRIMQFCIHCENHDSSTIDAEKKRELCSKCNQSYLCSLIARSPSVRPLLSLQKLAKGFAFLDGRDTVNIDDLRKAFPFVYFHRIELMNEAEIVNKREELQKLFEKLLQEINEVKEVFNLLDQLKIKYNEDDYNKLEEYCKSKIWMQEIKEIIDDYYNEVYQKLLDRFNKTTDITEKAKIYYIARKKLPENLANALKFDVKIKAKINAKVLNTFRKEFPEIYEMLKNNSSIYGMELELDGEVALLFIALCPNNYEIISPISSNSQKNE